jgi:hypothetical protein
MLIRETPCSRWIKSDRVILVSAIAGVFGSLSYFASLFI